MGRIKQKGKAGAAKAYITRTAAVKKLQCSLADFRRLCILKGIFPREPKNKKKANKGSSAPTSFYYAKDIAYLAHEPVLKKLREHKAFAKKLSRALGRGEWSSAKSLEENKPVYRLDHIIKERYPTFIDALRDIDDALCMAFLFASLPSDQRLPPELIENCARLSAEWQLYVMHSQSLRKAFLSIKGVYYQAEVMDQTITWLVPYQFTQNIPSDVDVRVMLTFLELYQTLLGFVFFKLYTDAGLVYPPPLDTKKFEGAAGVGAFSLQEATTSSKNPVTKHKVVEIDGRKISGKDVRQTIKTISASSGDMEMDPPQNDSSSPVDTVQEEDFVLHSSANSADSDATLPTLKTLETLPKPISTSLFAPYTFFLSRETSRSIFEFLIRSFGGKVGWPGSSGDGSPVDEDDPSITHVIIDRPVAPLRAESTEEKERRSRRKYVQPQWIVDCINSGKILLEESYAQGQTLPPHLSPFGEYEGAYDPTVGPVGSLPEVEESEAEDEVEGGSASIDEDEPEGTKHDLKKALEDAAVDPSALRAAELAAEAAGMDYDAFEKEVNKLGKKRAKKETTRAGEAEEEEMNKMMMSNKKRKLYEKMKYSQNKKETERSTLEAKKKAILARKKQEITRSPSPLYPPLQHFLLSWDVSLSITRACPRTDQTPLPPPYHDSRQSPLIVTETTTTRTQVVTTTTETTTHFLSFPAWRKRSNNNASSSQRPRIAGSLEGNPARTPLSQRDKALPPTPADISAHLPRLPDARNPKSRAKKSDRHEVASQKPATPLQSPLGLALPPRYAPASPTFSKNPKSEINTVAFTSTPCFQSTTEPSSNVRRSKSSQRLGSPSNLTPPDPETSRRTRGVSLLGITTSDTKASASQKGKERPSEPLKTLTRKSSFWNRRKDISSARPVTAHGDLSDLHNSLEINFSNLPPPLPRAQKLQARDPVSRSLSERPQSYYPTVSPEISVSPVDSPSSHTRRPSTAGSSTGFANRASSSRPGPTRTIAVSFSEVNGQAHVPRGRSQTNPPLLHRLSLNVFSPPSFLSSSPTSLPSSPLTTSSDLVRKSVVIPRPMENEESPEIYVRRLLDAVNKVEVTSILASSVEPFYVQALKAFIGRFNFVADPLDIALRKLLLEIGLPKETQQIDRVMEAFARRYTECNPDLYVSDDHPYILAFSLIMLHTDAFNKSNRHKMTKPDYIKNTSLPGVAPEILEYFYDNIVFAPFIFIEDPLDVNGQHGLVAESNRRSTVFGDLPSLNSGITSAGSTLAIKTNKIDPYYLISNDLLSPLRVDVKATIPLSNPFSYKGTAVKWDEEELLRAFTHAHVMDVGAESARSSPFFSIPAAGSSSPLISSPLGTGSVKREGDLTLRLTKVGVMDRKDELGESGKKPLSRKWKSWGVLLTGSQLLFSRDPARMQALISQTEKGGNDQVILPPSAILRVDELLSLKNAIAVFDTSYTKHQYTFRLVLGDGRHLLLKASSEEDMNQWIARINYASAFKTAGIRMRLSGMSGRNMELTGVAAATSHLHDLQNQTHSPSLDSGRWDENAPRALFEMLSGVPPMHKRPPTQQKVTLRTARDEVELEASVPLELEKTPEFMDAFDQVKADLATESWLQMGKGSDQTLTLSIPTSPSGELSPRARSSFELHSQISSSNDHSRPFSRSQIIEAKILELDDRLIATEKHLDTEMRIIHNVATLSPFQKATRDRLVVSLQTRARVIMQLRLEIARMRCHRNILRDDMLAENRIWKEVKDTALKAAKETLQSRRSPEASSLTLSSRELRHDSSQPIRLQNQKSESSICESFHTAIDFGPNWPSSDDLGSSFLTASRVADSPRPSTSGSFSSYRYDGNSSRIWKSESAFAVGSLADHDIMPRSEDAHVQHEKFYTALESPVEEAEEWDKTRCAKRVSLVRVPSTLDFFPISKRLTLNSSKPDS
ncbi:hypothetical protein NP233_g6415 [Leucocoprinus birnbaumii]|uniref:Pescadillo homolog n=1 Tax=Leucocoprinus birnbaumii TaxID=56174 RepID=A0AAD5VWN2_9AGAR|nr:hypothetical protein NP233_g6415 [Leucocoprinus birnbaumii]